jgi:hypothetical protein
LEGPVGVLLRVAGFAGSLVLNLGLFLVAFRVLTDRRLSWGEVFPGAAVGAVVWAILQAVGSFYVNHVVKNASEVYGFFGFVLGLLAWIYLGAQITLYAAEINVVRVNRLWPRGLVTQPPLEEADRRTLRQAAEVEERIPEEKVDVRFEGAGSPDGPQPTSGVPRDQGPSGDRHRGGFVRSAAVGVIAGVLTGIGLSRRKREPN